MDILPFGTVTFLFTDIEGSTKLAQEHPDEMPTLLARHHEILNQSIQTYNGYVFQIVGDSFAAAFHSASDALNAALDAQCTLQTSEFSKNSEVSVRVRMGIHTGTAQLNTDNLYSGYTTLASTQRIMSAGHGGQILLSGVTRDLVRDMLPENTELQDLGEKRLKDLLRPEHLYQLNIAGLPSTFPPLKTLDSFLNNLPAQLTTFIGREKEMEEIKKELESHRLVTLTGPGGAGKTRLSLQVGAACLEQFTNGVWFVELASLTDPLLIIGAVLSALGIHEKENDINSLTSYIGNQSLLLILDNCEHLIEDCARLVEILIQRCPKLHVLASSREALGIAGEQPYHVPSLPFPDPKHLPSLDEIAKCESMQLFVERVRAYIPSFSLTEKNASSVAHICSRLDGIPLAIELAAARVKVMSVEQLASRLGDVFNLLTSGSRTALPRQQTLRALIEWSYDLLSESEKSLFRRLAVFSGGWSLEAVEAVCVVGQDAVLSSSKDAILPHNVLDDLAGLVDKSLVNKEELDGEARFHMLETIRQYAEFKMFASEEVDEVKNRHGDWFMQLAETAEPKLRTGEQLPWLNRLEMEHDNLRAAMKWSIEQKHVEQALRIPSALAYFWDIHGHSEEGRTWLDEALKLEAQSPERKYPYPWATAVDGHFSLAVYLPDIKQYQPRMEEALDIFRKHGDSFRVGRVLYHLAGFPYFAGEHETAKSTWYEGLSAYQIINDQWGIGECLHCIAHTEELQGNIEKAHALFNQSLEALQPIGDRFSLFHPMGDTAVIAIHKGELNTARMILEESIQTFQELKNRVWVSISVIRLAQVLYERGEYGNARKTIQGNLEAVTEINDLEGIFYNTYLKGRVELAEGNLSLARQIFEEAFAIAEKENNQNHRGLMKTALGLIDCYEGNFARGREAIEIGIETVRREYPPDVWHLLSYRSHALWLEKDIPVAAQSYRDTIKELRGNFYFIRIPECLEGLGKVAVVQNELERAARLFGAAEAMREKMGTAIPPVQLRDYDAHLQTLRGNMRATFETLREEGRAMTMEQAIELALEEM
jgi:predicted ATPase/class 3 adenylate cyclase